MSALGASQAPAVCVAAETAQTDRLPPGLEWRESSPDGWADELAHWVGDRLRRTVESQGQALMYVSGGSSPVPVFRRLSELRLPWSQITVTLVDERVVPTAHPASNARLVQEHLLRGAARSARWVPWLRDLESSGDPVSDCFKQAELVEQTLQLLGRADLMLLGMGEDGHTASLFPQARGLSQALSRDQTRMSVPMVLDPLPPQAPFHRVSVTLAHILRSRQLVLAATGAAKKNLLAQALGSPALSYPISSVLHQSSTPLLVWTSP